MGRRGLAPLQERQGFAAGGGLCLGLHGGELGCDGDRIHFRHGVLLFRQAQSPHGWIAHGCGRPVHFGSIQLCEKKRLFDLSLVRKLLPGCALLCLPLQPFFGTFPGPDMILGLETRFGRSLFGLGDLLAQSLDFLLQRRRGIDWWRRRIEWAWPKALLPAVGAMEPDTELPGELQRSEGIAVIADHFMHGNVAELP